MSTFLILTNDYMYVYLQFDPFFHILFISCLFLCPIDMNRPLPTPFAVYNIV
ncbi:hypothetical protein AG1IA_02770 [Rhizoctonia solani AG-1 IA]|uniref:Uncharacterized protein n=1 Tax=Thanatephorus cucumeris (strain AG1-IA) TaxID=983506 RepID=L8X2C5_THACA|nr:hypothetical protein AG1IA_02770 [Rhizoctonia solani AG-1 IA]